jgi:hypothetical protein
MIRDSTSSSRSYSSSKACRLIGIRKRSTRFVVFSTFSTEITTSFAKAKRLDILVPSHFQGLDHPKN